MTSNRQIGQRNKLKTKKWLEQQGYVVANSEVNKVCFFKGKLFCVHQDLFGSDLIAMNKVEIVFVQCKSVKGDMSKAEKEFAKYPFPFFVKRWVVCWELRAREPIVKKL
jgi:hypothetical protein